MAVQFSLAYDDNGDPILVENTDTGTRKVITTSQVVSEYKSRFDMGDEPINDPTEDQPEDGDSIYNYINEMERGADNDPTLSFIEKHNLERYTPEAIKAKQTPLTKMQDLARKGFNLLAPGNVKAGIAILKAIESFLPEESPEVKAIKQFYADPETAALVESIPGMSNYNLVYGGFPGIKEASYGLANAAQKRQNTIDKTLATKYGLTPEEIAQTKLGTYKGPVSSDLIDRNKKLEDLKNKEKKEIDTNPVYNNNDGGGYIKPPGSYDTDTSTGGSGDHRTGGGGADMGAGSTTKSYDTDTSTGGSGDHRTGGGGADSGSQSSSSSSGESQYGGFCFDPNTLIQMVNGSQKKIKEIQLGDQTKGGEVTGVFQFKASDEIYDYKGVTVAGSHYVKEDGRFIMVQDSPISVKIDKIPVVYSLDTTGRRIFIKDIEFADYNGDGIAKGFLTNAGVDISGFDREVLRQVENRLI